MINAVNNLFGFSITVANIRATLLGYTSIRENLCNAFIQAFNYPQSYGSSVYQQIKYNSVLQSTIGLGNSTTYNTIENSIYDIINNAYPNENQQNKLNLALSANALIFSYYVYSDINISDFVILMNELMFYVSSIVNNSQLFTNGETTIFTETVISSILSNNYNSVIETIAIAPRNSISEIVNYNWFESEDIFINPNLQIMKDIENQYYYLSGQLIYQADESNLPNCIEIPLNISTQTGIISSTYLLNQPCVDNNSYIGPVTGVSFYREFNDGPFSSGDFNATVKSGYITFDEAILSGYEYQSNAQILYSFQTGSDSGYLPIAFPPVFVDTNGIYNINQEYINVPESNECSDTYSGNMHIGDNWQKIKCGRDVHNNCINCQFIDMTGFKFASLELNYSDWYKKFAYVKTNPPTPINSLLSRALNILPYSYISQDNSDGNLITANPSTNQPYLGYPQMSGQNSLPSLAFFQTFNSPTFEINASLGLFPAIGTSNNGTGINSDRTFQISNNLLFSGNSLTSAPIGETGVTILPFITSILSSNNNDDISKQFFGMGDNFGNQFNILTAISYNAGYEYTGIVISGTGIFENIILFNNLGTYPILGSQSEYIDIISGYTDGFNNPYTITQMFAQDSSGNLIPYYYLDNRNIPNNLQIQENQLYSFSPLPNTFETNPIFNRVSGTQLVENYLPRFASGAYSSQGETFLYPNASIADQLYSSKTNGFPIRINFTLNIREESVRELYARFFITPDGLITSNPYYVGVIRPNSLDIIDLTSITPVMNNIFVPNNSYFNSQYDFNNLGMNADIDSFQNYAALNMVDNNWSPSIYRYFSQDSFGNLIKQFSQSYITNNSLGYFIPSGKNTTVYNNTNNPFYQGIRLTGNGTTLSQWFTGTGNNQFNNFYIENPMGNGVFHYYQPLQITGYLLYTAPYFDLSSGQGIVNQAIQAAFNLMISGNVNRGCHGVGDEGSQQVVNSYYQTVDGITGLIAEGVDPIYLEYMGGRSGGYLVSQEGGYHSQGIIGDLWNNFSYNEYGMTGPICELSFGGQENPCPIVMRYPYSDNSLVLINSNTNNTNIFTRAMSFNPFYLPNIPFIPFDGSESYNYKLGNTNGSTVLNFSGDFATLSLKNYLPVKTIDNSILYDPTGLIIGPFDRDMELGVVSGNQLYTNSNLICNGNVITDPSGLGLWCDMNANIYGQPALDSGIYPGQNGRDTHFTIFAVIPKNGYAILNLSGISSGKIGFAHNSSSLLTLRPRKFINLSVYDSNIHFGEQGWIDPFMFIGNGIENKFSFNTSKFEDLTSQTYTFTTFNQSGKLYPIPFADFTGLANIDKFGNFTYLPNVGVEKYWKNYAVKNGQNVIVSGWREGSRISFQFQDISIEYDQMPYQVHNLIIPSGSCTISGEMGYLKQAESSIYSAGVILKDNTAPLLDGTDYEQLYFSDVLTRLPFLTGVSGLSTIPVLSAPSMMIQRQNVSVISGGQNYNKLFNYPPSDYNKFSWQAFSDLETLNAGETLEGELPDDPITFIKSSLLFSASQGQPLPNGNNNPIIDKIYDVSGAYQMYDSLATDALINSGKCITMLRGTRVRIQQSKDLSGILASLGTSLTMIKNGIT